MDRDELIGACLAARPDGMAAVKEVVEQALADGLAVGDDAYVELYRSDDLLVQQFLWPPGYSTQAHDHGGLWAVVGIAAGVEENRLFRARGDTLEHVVSREYHRGQVGALGPDVIHAVRNPRSQEWSAALHVYSGDLTRAPEPRSEWWEPDLCRRPYDSEGNVATYFAAVESARRADSSPRS
ncbi:MAG TPA: cysteine dioxygenase family protein [Acidimicrobiales bacterium]|nr:cysteine dioxygenase family protein [Acidimicrobiales bacterium]